MRKPRHPDNSKPYDTWDAGAHAEAHLRHMSDMEDWTHEGMNSNDEDYDHRERCYDKADEHKEKADFHARRHFELTRKKISQPDRKLRKKSNPLHVGEQTVEKNSLIESAVRLMSNQSEMGDRAASSSAQSQNPHSDRLHGAIQKAKGLRSDYKKAGGNESDLSKDQAEDFKQEGNPLAESSDDTDHEQGFRDSFERHLNWLKLSNNEPNEKIKGKLRTLSQIELNAAHGHAQLHWMRKGKSIHVGTSSKYDEYISSLKSPLVTKFR